MEAETRRHHDRGVLATAWLVGWLVGRLIVQATQSEASRSRDVVKGTTSRGSTTTSRGSQADHCQ